MATTITGRKADKITLTTASTEYKLSPTYPTPGVGWTGTYSIIIEVDTVGGNGIKFLTGPDGTLAANSNMQKVAGEKVILQLIPGNEDLYMVGASNNDSFEYTILPDYR